jgi:hypothetical protein
MPVEKQKFKIGFYHIGTDWHRRHNWHDVNLCFNCFYKTGRQLITRQERFNPVNYRYQVNHF